MLNVKLFTNLYDVDLSYYRLLFICMISTYQVVNPNLIKDIENNKLNFNEILVKTGLNGSNLSQNAKNLCKFLSYCFYSSDRFQNGDEDLADFYKQTQPLNHKRQNTLLPDMINKFKSFNFT